MTLRQLIWKRTKWGCPQKRCGHFGFSFKARPKKNATKERNPLEVLMYILFLAWRSFRICTALEWVPAPNQRGPTGMNADLTGCLHLLGRERALQFTLGCLERLGWCFPTRFCSPEADTALGWCRCPSKSSHSPQSSAHWLVPARQEAKDEEDEGRFQAFFQENKCKFQLKNQPRNL